MAPPEPTLDGGVSNTGLAFWNGGGPVVGDYDGLNPPLIGRQLFSFDISALPADATVVEATLRLYQVAVHGDPYANHGVVVVDHMDYGEDIDAGDYDLPALQSGIGVLATAYAERYESLDVTAAVQQDLVAQRVHSQYRLRFSGPESDGDGATDSVQFSDTEMSCCPTGAVPQLEIRYRRP